MAIFRLVLSHGSVPACSPNRSPMGDFWAWGGPRTSGCTDWSDCSYQDGKEFPEDVLMAAPQ